MDCINKLNEAVGKLPDFPSNLPNASITDKATGKISSYGPHDPFRVDTEREITGIARTALIADAVKTGITNGDILQIIEKVAKTQTAGETGKNEMPDYIVRVENLALSDATKDILKQFIKGENKNPEVVSVLTAELKDFPAHREIITAAQSSLMKKGYQLDPETDAFKNDLMLHSVSNERQYMDNEKLPDLLKNLQSVSTEFEQKAKAFRADIKSLKEQGFFETRKSFAIMDLGVEHGELTNEIRKTFKEICPDVELKIIAIERSGNFLKKADELLQSQQDEKFKYSSFVHHVADDIAINPNDTPENLQKNLKAIAERDERIKAIKMEGPVDMIIVNDVNNFKSAKLFAELREYSHDNTVIQMRHANEKDALQQIKDSIKPHIRHLTDVASGIDAAFAGYEHASGEMKAVIKLQPLTAEEVQKLVAIPQSDFMAKPFEEGSNAHKAQMFITFSVGVPMARLSPEIRQIPVEAYNELAGRNGGVAYSCGTSHCIPAFENRIEPEVKEKFYKAWEAGLKATQLMQDKVTGNRENDLGTQRIAG